MCVCIYIYVWAAVLSATGAGATHAVDACGKLGFTLTSIYAYVYIEI